MVWKINLKKEQIIKIIWLILFYQFYFFYHFILLSTFTNIFCINRKIFFIEKRKNKFKICYFGSIFNENNNN